MITQHIDRIAQEMEKAAKENQDIKEKGSMFYSSVAYLQSTDDTSLLDALKDKGDYEGLLKQAREYYDGNGMDEKYTFRSPLQNCGDDLLVEDKDFAVVYNGNVGGTYEVMLKFTEQEVRDHIRRNGTDRASEDVKELAREMVQKEFTALSERRMPVMEMKSGEILYLRYNRDKDSLDAGSVTNAGMAVRYSFPYAYDRSLDENLQNAYEKLSEMPEYENKEKEYAELERGGFHR